MNIPVFSYGLEEQETILRYSNLDKCWYIETNIQKHINRISKLKNVNVEITSINPSGGINCIRCKLNDKQIQFKNTIELTEERKQELRDRMNNIRVNQ